MTKVLTASDRIVQTIDRYVKSRTNEGQTITTEELIQVVDTELEIDIDERHVLDVLRHLGIVNSEKGAQRLSIIERSYEAFRSTSQRHHVHYPKTLDECSVVFQAAFRAAIDSAQEPGSVQS